jgi:hypothetical protein
VKGENEIMGALKFRVRDVAAVCAAARARGRAVAENEFLLGGVSFRVVT